MQVAGGWRQSRACGSVPHLGRMRPLAIYSLKLRFIARPSLAGARSELQWYRIRGIPRPTATRSRAFASASLASTISLRHTPRTASQTRSFGSYRIGLHKSALPSTGRSWKDPHPWPSKRLLALCVWIKRSNEACPCPPAGDPRLQLSWTEAHRRQASLEV